MLSELWTKVNTENVRRIARNTLFDFFFGDLEDLELKMKKRVLFLQIIRDPKITFEE